MNRAPRYFSWESRRRCVAGNGASPRGTSSGTRSRTVRSTFTEEKTETPVCLSTSQDSSSDANMNGNVISSTLHATNGDEMVRVAALTTSFAGALIALNSYRCRECIEILHSLPKQHFRSGWVQSTLGKAYFEMCEYKPALLALKEMIRLEPFRIKGIDILSTTLWHLRKDKELCSLAQQVVEVDKMSPETWCVVGNCFSLQRETETAIKFFERALQIDPTFTYAHTLCGHEMVSNEDLDKATKAFRNALRYDDRHYNALYGLGAIYYRQEKYDMAESHFRSAIKINPNSSVLHCYLGMVLHTQAQQLRDDDEVTNQLRENKTEEALGVLTEACKIDPHNPQLRFQRVHVLLSMKREQEALNDLEIVRNLAPREPPVYSLLGRIYHRMGRMNEAIRNFNTAVDLDPKGEGPVMKATLEGYNEDGDEEEFEQEEEEGGEGSEIEVSSEQGDDHLLNESFSMIRLSTGEIEEEDVLREAEDDGNSFNGDIDIDEDPDLTDSPIIDPNADQWGRSFDEDSEQDGDGYSVNGDDDDQMIHDGYDYSVDYQSPQQL